ncbi:MAG: hypothetical protein R1F52_07475 [Candidatus Nitrosoabyssus spongiisocia]|nr:MAG: hypothetical protein R1F52_07475 [Nitrosopumilaceae archaeon AB1(1)]
MRESFTRSEVHIDSENEQIDPILEQKEQAQQVIENATPEEPDTMLKALREQNTGKMQVNA